MDVSCFAGYEIAQPGIGPYAEPGGYHGVPMLPGLASLGPYAIPSGFFEVPPTPLEPELGPLAIPSG